MRTGADAMAGRRPVGPGQVVSVVSVVKRLHVGGDEQRLLSLAEHLDRTRFRHVVVVAQAPDAEKDSRIGPMLSRFAAAGVDLEVLGRDVVSVTAGPAPVRAPVTRRARDVVNTLAVLWELGRILRRRGADVVDGRLNFGTVVGLLAGRLSGTPVVTSTGYFPEHWRRPRVMEPVGQLALAGVDAFVTDADATVRAFDRWRWSRRAALVNIPNGVPPATSSLSRDEARSALGLPRGDGLRVVGSVCRMVEGKGYPTFLRAARRVLDAEPGTVFLFCGYAEDPEYRARLLALADELGLGSHAVFTAYPGPVGDVLRALDVYVRPSLEDSSPIGVHEAMSVGLPVVATRVGGTPELVRDGHEALLVPPEEPAELAEAVLRLLRDPHLAARLGQAGFQRYQERHRPEAMARAHEDLWMSLLDRRLRRSRGRFSRGSRTSRAAPPGHW